MSTPQDAESPEHPRRVSLYAISDLPFTTSRRRYTCGLSVSAHQLNHLPSEDIVPLHVKLPQRQRSTQKVSFKDFSGRQRLVLLSLALVNFISFCAMSIMAPFFPKEATAKGMSETLSGMVFSFYALVIFLSSPVFGKIFRKREKKSVENQEIQPGNQESRPGVKVVLPQVGARFLFMMGMFVAGTCNILFGLLINVHGFYEFTILCFLVRGMEAIGASSFTTASYVFVAQIFPDNLGFVMGILETFVGLGMSSGPAIGGLLYSLGGFGVPFYTLGIFMVAFVPFNMCLLPPEAGFGVERVTGSLGQLLKVPSVLIVGVIVIVASNTWSCLDPTLEPHLRQFNLSAQQLGLVFLLFSGLYGASSPVWGFLADKVNHHWGLMVAGLLLCTLGLLMLGPSPLLFFLPNALWLNLLALSILGAAMSLTLLPTFQGLLDSAVAGGCTDELSTHSLVAGIWSGMYSLGEVTGPSLGGFLMEVYGFPVCATIMAAATFIAAVLSFFFFVLRKNPTSTPRETSQCTSRDSGHGTGGGSGTVWDDYDERRPLLFTANNGSLRSLDNRESSFKFYTKEKVDLFMRHNHEDEDDDSRVSDVRKTMGITAGGACEV